LRGFWDEMPRARPLEHPDSLDFARKPQPPSWQGLQPAALNLEGQDVVLKAGDSLVRGFFCFLAHTHTPSSELLIARGGFGDLAASFFALFFWPPEKGTRMLRRRRLINFFKHVIQIVFKTVGSGGRGGRAGPGGCNLAA